MGAPIECPVSSLRDCRYIELQRQLSGDMARNGTETDDAIDQRASIQVTKRTNRSVYMFLLQHLLKPFKSQIVKPGRVFPAGSPKLDPHKKALKVCDVRERLVEGIYQYDLTAKVSQASRQPDYESTYNLAEKDAISDYQDDSEKPPRRRLYYFAGGGWQMPASSEHWALCADMAKNLANTTVSLVSYPLAPNSAAPGAFPQLMCLYRALLRDAEDAGEEVILAGDSAGGNIVLCLTLAALLEAPDSPCPTVLMVMSPSTDLTRLNPEMTAIERHDPILNIPFINSTAKKWRGQWDPSDPRVSPLYADLAPLARRGVQVHGITGRYDILGPDAILFREKCNQAQVKGQWLDWDKQMHCFPLTWSFKLPEGVQAKNWMLEVLRQQPELP